MKGWLGGTTGGRPATDAGERIYAIGDVHGRDDLLADMLERIEAHSAALPPAPAVHVILLGDLIDRGARSAEVLKLVYEAHRRTDRLVVLLGNHEELLLNAIDGKAGVVRAWMRAGGDETLRSFGIDPPERGADQASTVAKLRAAVPREWVAWLRGLPLTVRSGGYMFCHAGVRPGVPLRRQTRADLLWIKDDFLVDDSDHGAVVVHGHSVTDEVEVRPNRIGIDTGAYASGVLTAVYLEGTRRGFVATEPPPEKVILRA